MNSLNTAFLARGGSAFWITSCCKDVKPMIIKNVNKLIPCGIKYTDRHKIKECTGSFRIASGSTLWTQIRHFVLWQKDCPRLHRDIEMPNFDAYRKDEFVDTRRTSWGSGDKKMGHAYVIGFFGWLCGMYSVKSELTHFISTMAAAADVLALATIEIDLAKVAPGTCASFKWRGKPLFIKNRTQTEIDAEANTPLAALRDPQTPEQRAQKAEWLVVIGICTHLGCVPIPNSGDWAGGFYCPCHGSHYDNIGRARKGPAPLNLEVPPYKYVSDTLILVG